MNLNSIVESESESNSYIKFSRYHMTLNIASSDIEKQKEISLCNKNLKKNKHSKEMEPKTGVACIFLV